MKVIFLLGQKWAGSKTCRVKNGRVKNVPGQKRAGSKMCRVKNVPGQKWAGQKWSGQKWVGSKMSCNPPLVLEDKDKAKLSNKNGNK